MTEVTLTINGQTQTIDAPPMEGLHDRYFLVGIIMRNAENHTEISSLNHFFDALHNITHERVVNRCHH